MRCRHGSGGAVGASAAGGCGCGRAQRIQGDDRAQRIRWWRIQGGTSWPRYRRVFANLPTFRLFDLLESRRVGELALHSGERRAGVREIRRAVRSQVERAGDGGASWPRYRSVNANPPPAHSRCRGKGGSSLRTAPCEDPRRMPTGRRSAPHLVAGVKHEHSGWLEVQGGENVVTVHVFYRYRAVLAAVREIF